MANHGKRYNGAAAIVEQHHEYSVSEAMGLVKKTGSTKFDETVDAAVRLGVDPRHGDQMVRGQTNLPHGTGKSRQVAVFATGEKAEEAREAGAQEVGGEDLIAKIEGGWRDFDVLLAIPEMMPLVGRSLGRMLGPRMPSPRSGTVTLDIGPAVKDIVTASRVEYRVDRTGIVHCPIGKASFSADQLRENFNALMQALLRARPAGAKGRYLRTITVSCTMGPGVRVDPSDAQAELE